MKEKFSPGRIVATKGVADRAKEDKAFEEFCEMSLRRHLNGDWGEKTEEGRIRSDEALESGEGSSQCIQFTLSPKRTKRFGL